MALNPYKDVPMIINGVMVALLHIRQDQIKYFNITVDPIPPATPRTRKSHSRIKRSTRLDDTAGTTTTTVRSSNYDYSPSKRTLGRGGKAIKVPTELTSTPPSQAGQANPQTSTRMTVIRFPNKVTNSQISSWINTKFTSHKPTRFFTPSGVPYPVRAGVAPAPSPTPTP
ncbi:hypothetical protein [Chroococcidiopsis sp.]|uniref:hypothetical protein n=1 Tax=Chroococcidiopsis sp. TaxID=3088168 RepID=UPI003F3CD55C